METTKLQFLFPQDASGILYKVTTVLFAYGWDILSAYSRPNEDAEVEDIFIVSSTRHEALTKTACDTILAAVKELIEGDVTPRRFHRAVTGKAAANQERAGDPVRFCLRSLPETALFAPGS
jgi:hypothetical protein